jgi:BirA family biotin operon repressor/biotin-[acetyl-CoA-carboxylase] ligase
MPSTDKIIGNRIIRLATVPSTNTFAFRLAQEGTPEGCVVRADQQTAGRGRLGRRWDSRANLGLWFSFILRPEFPASQACLIPFFVSAALVESVQTCFQITPQVKWPNDLLFNGKKICGILSEAEFEKQQLKFLVVGVGINLWHLPEDFPPELRSKAGALQMFTDLPIDPEAFFQQILDDLNFFYDQVRQKGFDLILEIWKSFCDSLGKPIEVRQHSQLLTGVFHDLAPDGSLLLKCGREIIRVLAGDVKSVKE